MQDLKTVLIVVSDKGKVRFPFIETESIRAESTNVLSLDTRSYNGLKRNKIDTIGKLLENIDNGNLLNMRGMGKRSLNRILYELCVFQYGNLSPNKKKEYLMRIVELNTL